ncbi:hypothetical protein F5X96DRAFT_460235 [Biscogniauxia mediterranea]|nr:hypothetical protein F5X96DRAFT_460235 [Biscogniauxia mediterranea]
MRPSASKRVSATERKRERDKLNQRNKRQRERERIAALEETIHRLEQELRLATCITDFHPGSLLATTHNPTITSRSGSGSGSNSSFSPISSSSSSLSSSSTGLTMITLALEPLTELLNTLEWKRLPLITFSPLPPPLLLLQSDKVGAVVQRLRSTPNVATLLPATPKALDLLFGGSCNELADLIVSVLAPYPILPPEKFAIAWLVYLYFRWYIAPSEESFAAIPKHMRPTACQCLIEHPVHIIAILWPSLRDRLVLHWSKYSLESVFGLLSCTVRIRESFNGNFIKRENGGEPQVDEAFYERFIHEDGWGLLERFRTEYPELTEGIDDNIMIREEHLLPV